MEYHPWLHSLFYYGPFFTCYSAAYKFELPEGCLSDRIKQRTHRRFFYPGCSCKIPARLARSRKVEVCMMKKSIYVFLAVVLLLTVFPRHTAASEKSTYIYQTAMDVLELLGSEEGADFDHVADIIGDVVLIFGSDYVDEEVVDFVIEASKKIAAVANAEDTSQAIMEQVISAVMDAVSDHFGEDYGSLVIPFEENGYHVNIKFDPTDLITRNNKLTCTYEDTGIEEYQVVFFGNDTNTLKGLMTELQLPVSEGYTLDGAKSIDMDEIYPGISTLDFATVEYYDDGDVISVVICFYDLDETEHLRKMTENGILTVEDYSVPVDAQSYIDFMKSVGYAEDFYTTKIRHFTVAVS